VCLLENEHNDILRYVFVTGCFKSDYRANYLFS
jgi:hypothetical protein